MTALKVLLGWAVALLGLGGWFFKFTEDHPEQGHRRRLTKAGKIALPILILTVVGGAVWDIVSWRQDLRAKVEAKAAQAAQAQREQRLTEELLDTKKDLEEQTALSRSQFKLVQDITARLNAVDQAPPSSSVESVSEIARLTAQNADLQKQLAESRQTALRISDDSKREVGDMKRELVAIEAAIQKLQPLQIQSQVERVDKNPTPGLLPSLGTHVDVPSVGAEPKSEPTQRTETPTPKPPTPERPPDQGRIALPPTGKHGEILVTVRTDTKVAITQSAVEDILRRAEEVLNSAMVGAGQKKTVKFALSGEIQQIEPLTDNAAQKYDAKTVAAIRESERTGLYGADAIESLLLRNDNNDLTVNMVRSIVGSCSTAMPSGPGRSLGCGALGNSVVAFVPSAFRQTDLKGHWLDEQAIVWAHEMGHMMGLSDLPNSIISLLPKAGKNVNWLMSEPFREGKLALLPQEAAVIAAYPNNVVKQAELNEYIHSLLAKRR